MNKIFFASLLLSLFISCNSKVNCPPGNNLTKIKAVSLLTKTPIEDSTLKTFQSAGITHIVPIVFGLMKNTKTPLVTDNYGSGWYSENDRGIYDLARRARKHGMDIILKIQISPGEKNIENGDLGRLWFDDPKDMKIWEDSYTRIVMHYIDMANEIKSPLIVIGVEIDLMAARNEKYWRDLITDIRKKYNGKLTYGAGGNTGYKNIRFWDALDYIGLHAYYNLSDRKSPDLSELAESWYEIKGELQDLAYKWNKSIIFSEFGCRSTEGAASNMWKWERSSRDEPLDFGLQKRIYESMFRTFWNEPWFSGVAIWNVTAAWEAKTYLDKRRGPTPQFKPAWNVMARYFNRSRI